MAIGGLNKIMVYSKRWFQIKGKSAHKTVKNYCSSKDTIRNLKKKAKLIGYLLQLLRL